MLLSVLLTLYTIYKKKKTKKHWDFRSLLRMDRAWRRPLRSSNFDKQKIKFNIYLNIKTMKKFNSLLAATMTIVVLMNLEIKTLCFAFGIIFRIQKSKTIKKVNG